MIYYRVASQADPSPNWRWRSTVLTELQAVLHFLRLYRTIPPDHLLVFSCSSKEEMKEQLARANSGKVSTSVTAAQFLRERKILIGGMAEEVPDSGARERPGRASVALSDSSSWNEGSTSEHFSVERGMSAVSVVERRRAELERGPGGDHDTPYTFMLPTSLPQVLAWLRLAARVRRGEFVP